MPRNGSGTYSRAVSDYVYDTVISEADVNTEMDDIATALTASLAKDGQTTPTANLPMGGYRHTGVGNGSARTDYAALGQVQDGNVQWADAGGTADAITATYSPAVTALVDGQLAYVRASAANATTTPTFSPNGLTPRIIVKTGGVALAAGDIAADGHELILRFDLSNTRWELLNPKSASPSTASDTVEGVVELATTAETTTGTDATRAVTPAGLHNMTSLAGAAWFLDEDDMASDSATKVASQQSVKAYVDASVGGGLPAPDFTSSEQTVTNDTILDVAHGLGAIPTLVRVVLRCKTANLGFAPDEEVLAENLPTQGVDRGATIYRDATNVTLVQGSGISLHSQSSFNTTLITNASWRWVVEAWA